MYGWQARGGEMANKHHQAEEIVTRLRAVEILAGQGRPVAEAIRTTGVTAPI